MTLLFRKSSLKLTGQVILTGLLRKLDEKFRAVMIGPFGDPAI